ncbi:hypothetical protein OIU74_008419 [Salix koriyanagi]|uniref:Uncharacterized protein n=1 Tax=Salix koriyanagi TaxID=2511006 RepID=A0A9Q0NI50_9ROSI|nr:hypothetical protein OIU74_008419 [Salix koriyanagi]
MSPQSLTVCRLIMPVDEGDGHCGLSSDSSDFTGDPLGGLVYNLQVMFSSIPTYKETRLVGFRFNKGPTLKTHSCYLL